MTDLHPKNPRKVISVLVLLVAILAVLFFVQHCNQTAHAQFKLPSLPHIPTPNLPIPHFPGSSPQQPAADPKALIDMGKTTLDIVELNNPQRQDELGQSIALGISNHWPVSPSQPQMDYVTSVGLTIASITPRPELNFSFGILETGEVGAYSTPGGYVFVTRGTLLRMQDESELAGVLAHEIAHVVKDHGIQAVQHAKFKNLSSEAVQQYGQKFAAFKSQVDGALDTTLVSGFSQDKEREADAEAVNYLVAAGYDPRGLVRFLGRLQAEEQTLTGRQNMMKTHPPTAERIATLSRQIAGLSVIGGATLPERFLANIPRK